MKSGSRSGGCSVSKANGRHTDQLHFHVDGGPDLEVYLAIEVLRFIVLRSVSCGWLDAAQQVSSPEAATLCTA